MRQLIGEIIEFVLKVALIVALLNILLSWSGITITIGKKQDPAIWIYPQGSEEQRL